MNTKTFLLIAGCAAMACFAPAAQASLSIVSVVGGQPYNGQNYVSFDDLGLGSGVGTATAPSGSVLVTTSPNAKVVTGSVGGEYAAPFISASNGTLFGDATVSGADSTQYITTGSTGSVATASTTLGFSSGQQYLGLLWGSVDIYNTLTFYNTDSTIDVITGVDVNAFANGDQGVNGTYYVNINSDKPFDKVVATSSQFAFEFDNVAYGQNPVPEATTIVIWSVLGLIGFVGRRRRG